MNKMPGHEYRMNLNVVRTSGWYPSNLVQPVKFNGNIYQKDKKIPEPDPQFVKEMKRKDEKILQLRSEMKRIQNNPVNKLSAEHDDFTYTPRLVPLYRSHIKKNL
ncbi:MAG: hypothetical protein MJ252_00550 [archaeon]|nr:hypothetical protein [archaeon]